MYLLGKFFFSDSSSHHSTHEDNINLSPSSSSLPSGGVIGANGTNHNGHNHAEETPDGQHNHSVPVSSRGSHIQRESSSGSDMQSKGNHHFMRKIPPGAEASNILVGELNYLERPIIAFIRLSQSMMLGDLTEVPVPTRFLFILLGPEGNLARYHQIGRAVATLMSDEVFHDVAYKARNQQDLLAGIDEFLDAVTVLPPGEWDPSIRIEPPSHVPSQQSRITNKPEIEKDESLEEAKLREESGLNRTGRLFGGLINDIKRKRQCYIDDYKDALAVQCLASFFFIYFACLTPIVTFGGLLGSATKSRMAAIESLLSGAIVGTAYALFSGQPLTILGSTGPVLIFETMVYDISSEHGWDYLSIRLWIGMWMCLILILLVAFDASALVCYITRFTEENFATLISLIFIVKAIQELLHIAKDHPVKHFLPPLPLSNNCTFDNFSNSTDSDDDDLTNTSYINCTSLSNGTDPTENNFVMVPSYVSPVFLMSCLLFIATYIMLILLKDFKTAAFFPTKVRHFVSDFAVIIAIVTVTVIDFMTGLDVPKLDVPNEFKPTWEGRQWVVPFFGRNPWWSALIAILPAILATILVFMDQQITAVIVNRKENKLKKGCGYHLDLLIVAVCIGICAILGLPWFVAATVISMTHVNSLKVESECAAPGEKPQFLGVREQRVTHLLVFIMIGLSVFLTKLLHCIPMPVLYGVFLYMGTSSLKGSQFCDRILLMFMPQKYQPDYMYLRHVPTKRVHLFTLIQIACLAALWGIKSNKSTKIIFPLMVAAMIGVRKLLDFVFTQRELKILDDVMPESTKKKHDDEEDGKSKLRENEQDNKKVLEATPGFPMVQSGNVHIHLANGNVMTIPVTKMGENKQQLDGLSVNITEEMTKTRTWQNIDQNSSAELNRKFEGQMGSNKRGNKRDAIDEEEKKRLSIMNEGDEEDETKRLSVMNENDEEEDSGITINIHSPTPDPSISDLKGETRV
ncbi:SLC4A7 (predicted) [Pycnogonum litorale]